MTVQAKMRCISNSPPRWSTPDQEHPTRQVRLAPVYDPDPEHPNFAWSQATPSGYLELDITNPGAYEEFEVNKEYLVTFVPVEA